MILTKTVIVNIQTNKVKKYYIEKGYEIKEWGYYEIRVEDLLPFSSQVVSVQCDYCGEIFNQKYSNYYRGMKNIKKCACVHCQHKKNKEAMMLLYGVENMIQYAPFREKVEKTNLERFGSKNCLRNKSIIEKRKKTLKEKYGVDNPMKNKKFLEKAKKTNREKYGCENPMQNEKIKEKLKESNIEKYGVDNPMKLEEIRIKLQESMLADGTIHTSKNQKYLSDLYGAQLNKLFGMYAVDMFCEKENIYIEYDGTGHELGYKLGKVSEKEIIRKRCARYYYLKNNFNLRCVRIQHSKRKLPSDEVMLRIKNVCFNYLITTNHHCVIINIDKNIEEQLAELE